jgi:hypothetical protein
MVLSLEHVLQEVEEQEEKEVQQVFEVVGLDSAAEASRRIVWFEEKKTEIDAVVAKQIQPYLDKIEKIKQWGEVAKQEYNDKQSFYSAHLELFIRREIAQQEEAGKKPKKTISLPYGKIALKKQQPEFIRNEEELLPYAKETGFVKVKESVDWAELKKHCEVVEGKLVFAETGELVPGVEIIEKEDRFEIKLEV